MAGLGYQDFDLAIEREGDSYRSKVLNSPVGQAEETFEFPFEPLELENFFLRIGQPRRTVRRIGSDEGRAAEDFGAKLYETVFDGEIGIALLRSIDAAETKSEGVRIRLHLGDEPELAGLPWEYLYSENLGRFIVLSNHTPIVRYLELSGVIRPLQVDLPLRMLVVVSSPTDFDTLDVAVEQQKLEDSLARLVSSGTLEVDFTEDATIRSLQRRLRSDPNRPYHILHFIGHGGFDDATDEGVLLFEDENERGREVTGKTLGTLLHDHRSLRLVVLNACEGARASKNDPFGGVAHALLRNRIPAVVAMQFEITDQAAITFADEFYAALADNLPVDGAVSAARKAIMASDNDVEWGTPVLYLRAEDGRIFLLSDAVPPPPPPVVEPPPASAPPPPPRTLPTPIPALDESFEVDERVAEPEQIEEREVHATSVEEISPPGSPPVEETALPAEPDPIRTSGSWRADVAPVEPAKTGLSVAAKVGIGIGAAVLAVGAVSQLLPDDDPDPVATSTTLAADNTVAQTDTGGDDSPSTSATETTTAVVLGTGLGPTDSQDVIALFGTPDLDGDLFEWAGWPVFGSEHIVFENEWDGTDDHEVAWRIAYDTTGLYFAVVVADDIVAQQESGSGIFKGDSVNVDFDFAPFAQGSPNATDFQLLISPGDFASTSPAMHLFQGDGGVYSSVSPQPRVMSVEATRIEAGYVLEAGIPWSAFGGLLPSEAIGFRLSANDNDLPGRSIQQLMYSNAAGSSLFDTTTYGTLTFG